jgi:hypothetical protein
MKRSHLIMMCARTSTAVVEYLIDAINAAEMSGGIVPYPVPVPTKHLKPEEQKHYATAIAISLALYLLDERNHSQWNSLRKAARRKFGSQCSKKTYIECIGRLDFDE